ncbi:macro domain-containing protein [Cytobacillus gottheilii]|uniref:macro domain-containing protein n=1 Tax=Cytobacillus gottheilii TaxID=859144 RepID=UPI0009BC3680|nr:macro domain-containing protein [Cytobacillus gottheilii]
MIKQVNGNILNASENIIAHQVNCHSVMGAGLAKQLRSKYPDLFESYKTYCDSFSHDRQSLLGKCFFVLTNGKMIANVFGQYRYGRGQRHTNYIALEKGLESLKEAAEELELSVAIPYGIGCGLAGGDWEVVYEIIVRVFDDYDVTIYKYQ